MPTVKNKWWRGDDRDDEAGFAATRSDNEFHCIPKYLRVKGEAKM